MTRNEAEIPAVNTIRLRNIQLALPSQVAVTGRCLYPKPVREETADLASGCCGIQLDPEQ